jgi:GNAT superfamily N-acetyltransferase
MNIRAAHENEAPALSAIAFESKAYWPYSTEQLEAWRDDLTISPSTIAGSLVYVAEVNTEIAGFYVLHPAPAHWILEHFWVRPARMGRGIGRILLAHAASVATEGGAKVISIDADPHAEAFYSACGAHRVASVSAPLEGAPTRQRPQMLLAVGAA